MSNFCYYCMRDMGAAQVCPVCGHTNTETAAKQPKYALPCGAMLRERYVIGRVLGQGGFGITYMGYDAVLQSRVCIKEYYPVGSAIRDGQSSSCVTWSLGVRPEFSQAGKQSFVNEARKAVKLRDLASVVKVWDVFYENETAYIIMEFIEGVTLKEHLAAKSKPMTLQECCEALEPIMKDLQTIHSMGIIHRDISPDNLMRRKSGELVLLDMGAAKDMTIHHAEASMLVARKGFSPAEQYIQGGNIGPWTDVYALAATIYYCMTGHAPATPVERSSGLELNTRGMPPALADFFRQGLALQAKDRFKSMDALRQAMLAMAKTVSNQPFQPAAVPASARQPSAQVSRSQNPSAQVPRPQAQSAQVSRSQVQSAQVSQPQVQSAQVSRSQNPSAQVLRPQAQSAQVPRSQAQSAQVSRPQNPSVQAPRPQQQASSASGQPAATPRPQPKPVDPARESSEPVKTASGKSRMSLTILIAASVIGVALIVALLTVLVFIPNSRYKKAVALAEKGKYAQAIEAFEALNGYKDSRKQIKNAAYLAAVALYDEGKYEEAIDAFTALNGYKDSDDQIRACRSAIQDQAYDTAVALLNAGKYEEAIEAFAALDGYKDSDSMIEICRNGVDYQAAVKLFINGQYALAARTFYAMDGLEDSDNYLKRCRIEIGKAPNAVSAGFHHTAAVTSSGHVVTAGLTYSGEGNVNGWKDIVSIAVGWNHTVGLRANGTVVATGKNDYGQCNVSGWTDIVAIAAGAYSTVGLRANGTVVAVGNNSDGQCEVSGWSDIVAVAAGYSHTVGLKSDGTVVAKGDNGLKRCEVSGWRDIVAISAGDYHTVGLRADGTVVEVGTAYYGHSTVAKWTDIVAVVGGLYHTVGLRSDGTVVVSIFTGKADDDYGQGNVSNWRNIVAIAAGRGVTYGVKQDGNVAAVGKNDYKQCDVSGWGKIQIARK